MQPQATTNQLRLLTKLTGQDYRYKEISLFEASNLIAGFIEHRKHEKERRKAIIRHGRKNLKLQEGDYVPLSIFEVDFFSFEK